MPGTGRRKGVIVSQASAAEGFFAWSGWSHEMTAQSPPPPWTTLPSVQPNCQPQLGMLRRCWARCDAGRVLTKSVGELAVAAAAVVQADDHGLAAREAATQEDDDTAILEPEMGSDAKESSGASG